MREFESDEVQFCAYCLAKAKNPSDAVAAWSTMQAQHPDLVGMICLDSYKRSVLPPSIKKYTSEPLNYFVPYFYSKHIYFLDDKILKEMNENGTVSFGIDYTLMFDTNIASYINKMVRLEALGSIQPKIIQLIDEILHDNLNFDYLFYMIENIKKIPLFSAESPKSKISFWKSLDRDFRKNLVSLQIFRSIDCVQYKRTSNPEPLSTYRSAARQAINFSFNFYASADGRRFVLDFVLIQRLILLQLIGVVRIQLSSSRAAKNKMAEYFNYLHTVVGAYFDREAVIAHKYFLNRKNVGILGKFQRGMPKKRVLKKLDNIAWDMAAPRFMEKLIGSAKGFSSGRYFVPIFVSFDNSLRDLLSLFPVKGAIYNEKKGELIPLPKINTMQYFQSHGCEKELQHLYSESAKKERLSREKPTRKSVHKLIEQEYKKLRHVI